MRPKIYLFGDSITEESFDAGGWGARLANHFCRTVDVVLRGYSGYNTRWALKVLDKVFSASENGDDGDNAKGGVAPIAVTVFLGANDASLPDRYCHFQHVPLHEYKHNLHSIISYLQKRWPATHVILITPPPIDEDGRLRKQQNYEEIKCKFPFVENPEGLPERTNESAGAYAKECIAVAGEAGVAAIDLWTKMQQSPDWKTEYLRDGLHLTASGNGMVFEEVMLKLKGEGLSLETLPMELPHIADVDPNDPLKSFQY